MGDLLSVSPTCFQFGPNDSKFILKPIYGYMPKVLSTAFKPIIMLSALPPLEEDQDLTLLCPIRALRIYIERCAHLDSQNNSLFALVAVPKGIQSRSRDFIGG